MAETQETLLHDDNDDMSSWRVFESFTQSVFRRLAGEKEDGSIDYSVLTVAVLTLGLILIVEFFRHKIDYMAVGRPFFTTVLEGVYRELATLGIVEFGIYLFQTYYTDYNKDAKQLFADVHFMLFFAALFNALETVLLAFFTGRVSDRLWVKTEQLDVDNYLELREEFEKVNEKLAQERHESVRADRTAEVAFEWNLKGVKYSCKAIRDAVRNPRLNRKHHNLLVQVRFHELRVHFLKANDLPLNLKVSDYLKRSEMHVLKKMVHIKPFSWLLLTGGLNLLYFLMGMVAYVTEDLEKVGTSMSAIFICSLFAMVIVSLAIFNKVKRVYRAIMKEKLIDCVVGDDEGGGSSVDASYRRKEKQMKLFWGGEPKYIIGMMQLMQIGFALSISLLIVFTEEIDGRIKTGYYALIVGLANALFLYIGARVIPRYTLCTSLGQLVNKHRLQETLAAHHLKETLKKQRILREAKQAEEEYLLQQAQEQAKAQVKRDAQRSKDADIDDKWLNGGHRSDDALNRLSTRSTLSALALEGTQVASKKEHDEMSDLSASDGSLNRVLLSELTETKTEDLRSLVPKELLLSSNKKSALSREERIKARRSARKRAVSDGVASMRLMRTPGKMSGAAQVTLSSVNEGEDNVSAAAPLPAIGEPTMGDLGAKLTRRRERSRRKKSLSANAAIELMAKVAAAEEKDAQLHHERRSPEKTPTLNPLIEGIPIMSVPATELSIPVGRSSLGAQESHGEFAGAEGRAGGISAGPQGRGKSPNKVVSFSETQNTQSLENPSSPFTPLASDPSGAANEEAQFVSDVVPENATSRSDDSAEGSRNAKADGVVTSDIDDDTLDSSGSDDGHSDAGDIPEIDPSERRRQDFAKPVKSIDQKCREFFQGRVYRHMSAVFGTMVCFFLVGMRVESLLHASNTVPDPGNTWELLPAVDFWLETAWLSMFIIISSSIVVLFRAGQPVPYKARVKMSIAAVLDVLLSSLCLLLLMLSELQRECSSEETRLLAESDVRCSQQFGNRVGDGVGNIEPFTSLIALRLLRFFVARKLSRFLCRRKPEFQGPAEHVEFHLGIYDEQTVHGNTSGGHKGHTKGLQHETGTFIELWNHGITKYPEVVKRHGEFSGELLQAMLGIDIVDEPPQKLLREAPSEVPPGGDHSVNPSKHQTCGEEGETKSPTKSSMSLGRRYSKLSAEAQSVILAGKIGKPVRSVSDASKAERSDTSSPNKSLSPLAVAQFEVDTSKNELEVDDANTASGKGSSIFVAPNARLIRSMRRCDKKLLPLLDTWTTVDVVITKFEIVYFEAPTKFEYEYSESVGCGEATEKGRSVHQAVVATNGGKGLRLSDVAEGRKVVGHLDLSSVYAATVERIIPKKDAASGSVGKLDTESIADEFWKPLPPQDDSTTSSLLSPRENRWSRVKEDHLIVDSIHGMLHLRFYSDLIDAEMHFERLWNEREADGEICKNNSLQWCQTLVRICGTTQLKKQHLPHFGNDDSDELRDYLVVDDHNLREMHRVAKTSKMRRTKSGVSLAGMLDRKTPKLSRGSSIGDHSSNGSSGRRFSNTKVARSSSVGEGSTNTDSKGHRKTRSASASSAGGYCSSVDMV